MIRIIIVKSIEHSIIRFGFGVVCDCCKWNKTNIERWDIWQITIWPSIHIILNMILWKGQKLPQG
jgi:hypothetical protein